MFSCKFTMCCVIVGYSLCCVVSANRPEFVRIQQQLEGETFPSMFPGGAPRAFYQLTRDEKAAAEKKRLAEYCKKSYKKVCSSVLDQLAYICTCILY